MSASLDTHTITPTDQEMEHLDNLVGVIDGLFAAGHVRA
jgi:hypothetical protein